MTDIYRNLIAFVAAIAVIMLGSALRVAPAQDYDYAMVLPTSMGIVFDRYCGGVTPNRRKDIDRYIRTLKVTQKAWDDNIARVEELREKLGTEAWCTIMLTDGSYIWCSWHVDPDPPCGLWGLRQFIARYGVPHDRTVPSAKPAPPALGRIGPGGKEMPAPK
jgi:hypothetical protein